MKNTPAIVTTSYRGQNVMPKLARKGKIRDKNNFQCYTEFPSPSFQILDLGETI
jgi:hypothetical protein